ncbi:GntR family transcriptional regulator [Cohnella ginsengisoli]|uniref:GntR family transcriptional regulator n=1 Tax=Cohnella ginsengisoli TaxID=425004 RepID=A0A9X4KGE8_9BACL|nr:GntR family transcriptional regulator [Cohnella ginsengisoli]MDG0791697.1 GntR family transcriptional regulator [Cohnella ginsengisoli]
MDHTESRSHKRTPLYAQIESYVRDQIRSGKWKPGKRLPSENQLCKQFDVSRITIRGAMDKLVEEGVVFRIQGRGSFVAEEAGMGEPAKYAFGRETSGERELQAVAVILPRLQGMLTTSLLAGVERALEPSRFRMLLLTTDDSQEKEEVKLQEALRAGARGVIVYPAEGRTYSEEMLRLTLDRYPIVVIDRYVRGVPTHCVCSDHIAGAYEATEHLLRLGHRRIGFVTTPYEGTTSLEERLEGFRQALNDYGVVLDRSLVLERAEPDAIANFLAAASNVTALFAVNEQIGQIAIRAAEAAGMRVPEDLSVVFFDDYDHADAARIPPTCVAQQGDTIGFEAAGRLLSLFANPNQERSMVRIPTRLIVRASTAAPKSGEQVERDAAWDPL